MQESEKQIYVATKEWHEDLVARLMHLRKQVSTCRDMKELADAFYALRETEKLANDIAKECRLVMDVLAKAVGALFVNEALTNPSMTKITTDYCFAEPDVKSAVSIPSRKRDPEGYKKLLQHLGIPEHLIGDDSDDGVKPISVNWKGMTDYVSDMIARGEPLPPCFDPSVTYPVYKLSVRKRKEVDAA